MSKPENEPVLTMEDWQAEIDAARGKEKFCGMTENQYEFIRYARENTRPVAWDKIAEIYGKRFGERVNPNTLSTRYRNECQRRGEKH